MLIVLTLAAFIAAMISGVLGMGGGALLLATLFCFLPHGQAIPVHAAVQMVSNGTRVAAFWRDVDWRTVGRFAIGLVPGSALAGVILWSLGEPGRAEPYLKIIIGVYILTLTFLPKPAKKTAAGTWWDWPALGFVAGSAALTVGAVGPLIAPLFARRDFVKERLIATKAVCQMLLHVLKIPVFALLGTIQFAEFSLLLACMIAVVIPGTLLGKRLLRHVSAETFTLLYRLALTTAGLKVLIVDGLVELARH
jgi:uncharacterized membrane protein YfcA